MMTTEVNHRIACQRCGVLCRTLPASGASGTLPALWLCDNPAHPGVLLLCDACACRLNPKPSMGEVHE